MSVNFEHVPQTHAAYILIAVSLGFTSLEKALEGTQLSQQSLEDSELIDLTDAIRVARNIHAHSKNPNFAAIFGNHLGIVTHGPVGYAAVSAPTIGRALTTFLEWFYIRSECYTSKLSETDDAFEINIFDTSGDEYYKTFFFESFIRAFEVLIGLLLGSFKTGQTTLYFESNAHDRQHLMREEYASKLIFGAKSNKLVVPKSIWYQPSPLSDMDSHDFNIRKCQQISDSLQKNNRLDIAVKNLIRNSIEQRIANRDPHSSLPSLQQVSDELHQSERTMVRKLSQYGSSFQEILEQLRKIYADKLLRDARYTVTDLTAILGYTESASFCRAFKKWFGKTPSAYRRNPPQ